MSQISPPMRIALAVAVLFGVVYMVALKPKNEVTPVATPVATPAPASASASDANKAHTGLGKAVEAAHGARDAVEKSQAAQDDETTSAPATTAPSTTQSKPSTSASTTTDTAPATDDSQLADLPTWLQKSMDHKVVAILFTNNRSADDIATRKALNHAYTAHGKVVTRAVPVSEISKYRPVAEGVDVSQSPTLMVIDRARSAQALVGYANVNAINQAIIDGLLATDNPVEHVKYLQTVQRECRQITNQSIIGDTAATDMGGVRKNVDALIATIGSSLGTLRNAPVPPAYRGVGKLVNRYLAAELAIGKDVRSTAIGQRFVDSVKVRQITSRDDQLEHRAKLELNAVGVTSCN